MNPMIILYYQRGLVADGIWFIEIICYDPLKPHWTTSTPPLVLLFGISHSHGGNGLL